MAFKVLFVSIYSREEGGDGLEELGVASIAALMRKQGFEVMIKGGYEGQLDYDEIMRFDPDIIGGSVYTISKDSFYTFCKKIKQNLKDVYICIGGYLPTYYDVEMMKEADFVDFIVRGEGEYTFFELVSSLENQKELKDIKGLTYRSGDSIVVNERRDLIPDIDILPSPSRDYLIENNLKIAALATSRGCFANCSFCVARDFWKKWRTRSVRNILSIIKSLYDLGIKRINFIDLSFEDSHRGMSRILEIARGIIDMNLDISYFIDIRAEFYKKLTPKLVDLLKKSGLSAVLLGIETANREDLKLYGKRAALEDNYNSIEFFRKLDINTKIGFINFNPYSRFKGLNENVNFLEKYGFAYDYKIMITRYRLTRGSRLYDKIKNDNLMGNGRYDDAYNYNFVDERILRLYNFLYGYFRELSDIFSNLIAMPVYLLRLSDTKKRLKNNIKAFCLVIKYEQKIVGILDSLNRSNAQCFRHLLSLAENNWKKKEAEKTIRAFLGRKYLLEIISHLKEKAIDFFTNLYSLDKNDDSIVSFLYNTSAVKGKKKGRKMPN